MSESSRFTTTSTAAPISSGGARSKILFRMEQDVAAITLRRWPRAYRRRRMSGARERIVLPYPGARSRVNA